MTGGGKPPSTDDLQRRINELEAERKDLVARIAALGSQLLNLQARHLEDTRRIEASGQPVSSLATALVQAVKAADEALADVSDAPRFTIAQLECDLPGVLTGTAGDVLFRSPGPTALNAPALGAVRMRIVKAPADSLQR